jgi:hypothetical protein
VAARSTVWVFGRSPAGIAGSNPAGGHGYLSLERVVYCQVGDSASGWSPVQMSPNECGVSGCDRKALTMKRPWDTWGCSAEGKGSSGHYIYVRM